MSQIHKSAWLLVLLSTVLQILIFPLPNLYVLSWVAITPLLIAILRARPPKTLQLQAGIKLLPASPLQAFVLAYACGILWYAGTCYWIYNIMHQYGGVSTPAGIGILILFCLYLAIYHGVFGFGQSARWQRSPLNLRALLLSPVVWVAVELARTRVTGFPLGPPRHDSGGQHSSGSHRLGDGRLRTVVRNHAGQCGFGCCFLGGTRKAQTTACLPSSVAALILQAGQFGSRARKFPPTAARSWSRPMCPFSKVPTGRSNTSTTLCAILSEISLNSNGGPHPDLIVWPESPAPFYTSDPLFRDAVSNVARKSNAWMLVGSIGTRNASATPDQPTEIYNSASLVSPNGEWTSRYDKIHLVPFGEYVPFKRLFSFAGGLTKEVGDFSRGTSRAPLDAGGTKLGHVHLLRIDLPGRNPAVRRQRSAGAGEHFQRRLVRRQRRLRAASEAGAHARRGK